MYNNLVMKVH